MKNYLFAPFKNDDDKIREFNAMLKALLHLVDAEHELHVIRVFVCRLESYHDSIVQDMHNNKAEIVDGLLAEIKELKAELDKEKEFAIETSIKNDRLMSQVSSNRGNSSSTHTHTKETEIDAEMIDKHGNVKTIKCYTKDM